jgi:outer membrane protein assembly factor BamA
VANHRGLNLHVAWLVGVTLGALLAAAPPSEAQEPQTRQEALRQQREEKSRTLSPPERSGLERALFDLESGRLLERLLNPAEGFYPKLGNITAGSGFSFGPAYRKPGLLGGHADFSAFAAASFQRYWMLDTRLTLPRLANERVVADVHAQRYEFPDEDFFGIGPDSRRADQVAYGVASSVFGGTGSVRPRQWLTVGAGLDYLTPHVSTLGDGLRIDTLFNEQTAPGLATQPDFLRYKLFADLNYREPRGNPRRGGRYAVALERFDDRNGDDYSFRRVEADLQQYFSMLNDRRVLALHALVSTSDADPGRQVPFYFQRTLGGPDDLRGFRRFRFRDNHMLLLQAEYRWEIFTAVDGAIFYDAGKVAPRLEDLSFSDLESDFGLGFRFGTINGVFLRVEGAFGSREGKHFILRFGHVF